MNNNKSSLTPMLIPKDSFVEGHIKTVKSIPLNTLLMERFSPK